MTSCGTLTTFLVAWSFEAAAQEPVREAWTNNAFGISVGRFWSLPPRSTHTSGPPRELRIVGLTQWNVGLSYERHTRERWSYGALVDVTQPFFGIEAQVDDPAHGNPPGSTTARVKGKTRLLPEFYYWECMAFAGIPVHVRERWRLDAAVEAGINPRWNTSITTLFGHTASTDTGTIGVFVGGLGADLDIYPMVGFRFNASYSPPSLDRLMIALEGRASVTPFWDGGYNMYGFTSNRSEGTFSGHLAYIGFRMGYAFTWGPPRKPKWMRRQEAAGRPVPTP
ncbi:MAG: hypothetical protein GFGODING_01320 [Flavobacteriales bacterium]|nr:hypothetical protein [Flavobacteriales bacterium]